MVFLILSCKRPFGAEPRIQMWVNINVPQAFTIVKGQGYPDTTLPIIFVGAGVTGINKVSIQFNEPDFKNLFKKLPADTLNIFIISNDTLKAYEWTQIREDYNILQRYDLSHEDLKKRNYEIEYPYDSTIGSLKVWKP